MKLDNVKMLVQPHQTREIQRIAFSKGLTWDYCSDSKTKTSNILYIDNNRLSWETSSLSYSKNHEEVKADDFIRENTQFPVYKIQKDGLYIVEFISINIGRVVWVGNECKVVRVNQRHQDDWGAFYEDCWKNISEEETLELINQRNNQEPTNSGVEIPQGTIVQATRKSTNEKHQDYTWQATYYGKFNEHYLVDFNGTHYQIADSISIIPTLTKKEAKQKIAELFGQPKNVTSEKIRNIIDLIKL